MKCLRTGFYYTVFYLHSWQNAPVTPGGHSHLKGATQLPPFWQPGWQKAKKQIKSEISYLFTMEKLKKHYCSHLVQECYSSGKNTTHANQENSALSLYVYRVNHKFGNALFCWLWVSWWKETRFSLPKWKVHGKASKWYQLCFSALSIIGARWQEKNSKAGFCEICQAFRFFLLNLTISIEES